MKKSLLLLLSLYLAISNANAWLIDTTGVKFETNVFNGINEFVHKRTTPIRNWKYVIETEGLYYNRGRCRLYVDGEGLYYAPSGIPMVGGSSYTTSGIMWLSADGGYTQLHNMFLFTDFIYSLELEYCKFDNLENIYLGLYCDYAQKSEPELIRETNGVKFYRQTFYPYYPTKSLDIYMEFIPNETSATQTKFVTENNLSKVQGFVANHITIVGTSNSMRSSMTTALNYYRNNDRHDKTLTYFKEKYSDTSGADVNEDGAVNSADVVSVYNTIINGAGNPQQVASHAYADLGLPSGTKWATMNLGAQYPEDMGDYYAYNEKNGYSYYTNKHLFMSSNYYERTRDIKEGQDLWYTPVGYLWGNGWTMPTLEEWDELFDSNYTTSTFIEIASKDGSTVKGLKVTSKSTGQSIFLPAAGRITSTGMEKDDMGHYWTTKSSEIGTTSAYLYGFSKNSEPHSAVGPRRLGLSIRPVIKLE